MVLPLTNISTFEFAWTTSPGLIIEKFVVGCNISMREPEGNKLSTTWK